MGDAIEFTLNGRLVRATGCSPNTPLLDYLRSRGLTGSKEGCAEGDCGACSVALLDQDSNGKACYRAINSCLVPICLMSGRELVSVEGVASKCPSIAAKKSDHKKLAHEKTLHPVQQQMVECHGSQCGYCTPGFIMSLFEGYYRTDLKTADQLDDQLSGNLCRCTGYRSIREAATRAFAERNNRNGEDAFTTRLKTAQPNPGAVDFYYRDEAFIRPTSLVDLLQARQAHPEGRLIAGATELGLEISKRFKKFPTLISVEAVKELKELKSTSGEWRIGGAVTLTQIEEQVAPEFPAMGRMLRVFGSRQIRNRATMGGNIVTASPIGDSALVLLALDAQVVLASLKSNGKPNSKSAEAGTPSLVTERTLPISEFFLAYRKTALRPDEVLKTIVIPRLKIPKGITRKCEWYKVSKRREMDISIVAACFSVALERTGTVQEVRLAYGGVAALSLRAKQTEAALLGKSWNQETIESVLPVLAKEFTPISDVRGDAEYRQGLIISLLKKFYFDSTHAERDGEADRETLALQQGFTREEKPPPHDSAHKHVTGEAGYTDDFTDGKRMLETWPVCSPHAKARILKRDASAARTMPGIKAVLLAEDVPGTNDVGTKHDEPLFPDKEVSYHGQIVALVIGDSAELCRAAAEKVVIEYAPAEPLLTLPQAVSAGSFHNEPNFIRRGNVSEALANSQFKLTGAFELGGQEHFYLETQAAWAQPGEDGSVLVASSTQHPSEVQMVVAHVLKLPINKVVVQAPRMGGGFGGKETQAAQPAALAALAATLTGAPVRVRFNRDQDMMITGHRHPFLAQFEIGFDQSGSVQAAKIALISNGGWAIDLSQAVTDRALFHLDNAYYLPAVEFSGRVAKTNLSSNTAFRGFGGPQGMLVIEEILDRIARRCGIAPEIVRERNLYHGKGETNTTHYGQEIEDNRLQTIWSELKKSSDLAARRKKIEAWNARHPHRKRGIAVTPVKFGISFTVTHLNQAGALVLIYQDGTLQVNHGGTEMGQGLHTNMRAIASQTLGVKTEDIRVMLTSTDKIPNTSATAASCGTDLNGAAVKNACEILRARLQPIAATLLREKNGRVTRPDAVVFANDVIYDRKRPRETIPFVKVICRAYLQRVQLSANGFYCTPGIHWDRAAGRGKPFHYFACGAAVAEVEVDGFTGMHRLLRADLLHDVGESINVGINRGQVEGGFIQGMGWLTTEELKWDAKGRLLTHSPDTYKLPAIGDAPHVFNVTLLKNAAQKNVVHGSKAVGEPPLMLAISVREAIRDAVAAFGNAGSEVPLASPATCEAIFMAIKNCRKTTGRATVPANGVFKLGTGRASQRMAVKPAARKTS